MCTWKGKSVIMKECKKKLNFNGEPVERSGECAICKRLVTNLEVFYYAEIPHDKGLKKAKTYVCYKHYCELIDCYDLESFAYLPAEQKEIVAIRRLKNSFNMSSKNNNDK